MGDQSGPAKGQFWRLGIPLAVCLAAALFGLMRRRMPARCAHAAKLVQATPALDSSVASGQAG